MIEFVTVDGDHVWVMRDKIILVTGAKTQANGGPAVPAIGICMVALQGGVPPLVVRGSLAEVTARINDGRSSILST